MTRVSIESSCEYLSWLLDLEEFSQLEVSNRLEYESRECDNDTNYEKYLLDSSLRKGARGILL